MVGRGGSREAAFACFKAPPTEYPLRPAVGVNAPEYNRRRDLAPLAENRLLAVLFYAW